MLRPMLFAVLRPTLFAVLRSILFAGGDEVRRLPKEVPFFFFSLQFFGGRSADYNPSVTTYVPLRALALCGSRMTRYCLIDYMYRERTEWGI